MAGEGIVSIGATFDKTNVDAGLGSVQEMVRGTMESISSDVTQAAAKSRSAWKNLSEDVKAASATVTEEALKVAEATRLQAEAFADLRRAQILSRDASLSEAQQNAVLAAAQQKVAEATAQVAAAKEAEAASVTAANEQEVFSENVVVAAFQRAAASISEASAEIREQLVATAETGGLEAEGITAGFAGFSKLLGAGIAVGFAANYIDGLAKVNVELEHLSAKTRISIESLAGLQQILKESGGDFETVATGLVRMESNTEKLAQHSKPLEDAFTNLGLKLEDVWKAKPEELLQMIATGMAKTTDANILANSAITIFGRGGQALIPILTEQGAALTANMKTTGQLTRITTESAEAARRWTQDVAHLAAQFRSAAIPVMEHAEFVIRIVASSFEAVAAFGVSAFEAVATAVVAAMAPVAKLSQALYDLVTGNFRQMVVDARGTTSAFTDSWKAGFNEIKANWQEVYHTFADRSPLPPLPKDPTAPDSDLPGKKPKKIRDTAFQHDEEELNALRLETAQRGYALGVQGEIDFWQKKLDAAKKGTQEYESIIGKLASLEEQRLKAGKKKQDLAEVHPGNISNADLTSITSEMSKEVKDEQKQQVEAQREAIDEEIRMAAEAYRTAEQYAADQVRLGRMTAQERITYLQQAANEEARIEQALVQAKTILDNGELVHEQKDANQSVQIARRQAQQIRQLMQQSAQETQQVWMQAWQKMTSEFNDAVAKWAVTGKGFTQSLAQIWGGMVENFTRNILKMTEQYLLGLAMQKAGQKSQIFADAKTAAANTYSAVSAIPVVGPFLAPVAAAGAFAGVMALDSFSEGGMVQGGGGMAVPILAHAGERVLSPSQTQNFETLVNTRTSTSSANNTLNMGGIEQHFHGSQASPREAARGMQDAIRRGRLRFA
jgi:hypothetical protein